MKKRSNRPNGKSIVAPSKNIGFRPSFKGFGFSDLPSKFDDVIKAALARQQSSPGFHVTVLDPVAVKEQVGKVIGRVDA